MNLVVVSMVRDEADVIEPLAHHLFAEGATRWLVADNLSVDGTRQILERLARHYDIEIIDDPVVGYYQSLKVSKLSQQAFAGGADWVLPCDADEIFFSPDGRTVGEALSECPADIVMAHGFDYLAQRADDSNESNPFVRIGHRRQQTQRMGKIAFRAHPNALVHQGSHGVERPGPRIDDVLAYGHWQWRSFEHMKRKARQGKEAYEASTLGEKHGTHWRRLGAWNDEELMGEWNKLLDEPALIFDPCPIRKQP